MLAVFKTDRGQVRPHNEDDGGVFINSRGEMLAIVADGMGGHKAGEVASGIAVSLLKEQWDEVNQNLSPTEAEQWFHEHVAAVNKKIFQHSIENSQCEGMGTTIVAAICTDRFVTVANVGDSRCYVLNDQGYAQLTEDHSFVNELVKTGQISPEDAAHHPRKNIVLKAAGTQEEIEIDTKTVTFEEGDKILLCSDGLSDKVSKAEMEGILKTPLPGEDKADNLIQLANQYGGEDNISLVIVEYEARDESRCNEC
ncbi:Stp1/IreP family PP2C-type Ser/Thr phosphatase [Siminovitchia acidinfaciens]|uniref:protein-serine/threonine phosphatase n=1 Tax=Siminovitchia acidinfaciens TaxID=2321395 RepID=A0A429Y2H9_9BACI|nr:Stp1/IreP family PP2C-type Ser/Thr phosphatase [Siminovitchia acidinfaciens]RST75445.1 Stp1/IreP family PP2C-type Ser/Thr phosphatase [Siminovitchia acidinfaciens]